MLELVLKNSKFIFIQTYFVVFFNNFKRGGIYWLLKAFIIRITKDILWIALLPIALILHFLRVRRLLIRVEHIGHLAVEPDTYIKGKQLGVISNQYKFFIIAPRDKVSNLHLLSYWKDHFLIISNPLLCLFLGILTRRILMRYDVSHFTSAFFGTQEVYSINKKWDERPPILKLTSQDENWATAEFEKLGIDKNRWFVCLHVREPGFLPHNEVIQSHRNASIYTTIPAVNEIVKCGGIVIRMGDPTMTPYPAIEGVIDYAHHLLRSERLDVLLCAKAKFFLGSTSGLAFLSMIFGVPLAQANMIPFTTMGIRKNDISIPKLLINAKSGKYFNFKTIFNTDIGGYFFANQYSNNSIGYIENTDEEILNLVIEMMHRLDNTYKETLEERKLHQKFMDYYKEGHYSYGAVSRINIDFLKKYRILLH